MKSRNKFVFLSFLALLSALIFISVAMAVTNINDEKTAIGVSAEANVKISDVRVTPQSDRLEITATLINSSNNLTTSPLTYSASLLSIESTKKQGGVNITPPSLLVSALEGKDYFILKPKE